MDYNNTVRLPDPLARKGRQFLIIIGRVIILPSACNVMQAA